MNITYTCPHCQFELEYDYTPERPAPCCSNHDSPAFSDPGEGAECDGPDVCTNCGEDIDMDKVMDPAAEDCDSSAYDGPDTEAERDSEV